MRYVFIVNPTAGKKNTVAEVTQQINEYFKDKDLEYKILKTKKQGDGTILAKQEAEVGDELTIFSIGGEGTNFEVVNGIAGYTNVTFGILPHGTGNDFVKAFGDKQKFLNLEEQMNGEAIKLDAIKFEDKLMINQGCCGMDAMVAANVSKFKRFAQGALAYEMSIVYTVFKSFKAKMKIIIDGKVLPITKSLFMTCANGPYYGGGYKSAPTANPCDGILNYSVIKTGSKIKALTILGKYKKGQHYNKPYCEYGECKEMEIISDTELPIVLDGEIVYRKNVKFTLVEKALNFNIPKSLVDKFVNKKETVKA